MIDDNSVKALTTSVWDSILHLPIVVQSDPLPSGQRTMIASVYITGAWRGAVSLSCEIPMAAQAAGIMFGLTPEAAAVADMQDALGELVNMIGGNVRTLLPPACHVSLPAVVEGSDYTVRIPGSTLLTTVCMRCGDHALSVSVAESRDQAA